MDLEDLKIEAERETGRARLSAARGRYLLAMVELAHAKNSMVEPEYAELYRLLGIDSRTDGWGDELERIVAVEEAQKEVEARENIMMTAEIELDGSEFQLLLQASEAQKLSATADMETLRAENRCLIQTLADAEKSRQTHAQEMAYALEFADLKDAAEEAESWQQEEEEKAQEEISELEAALSVAKGELKRAMGAGAVVMVNAAEFIPPVIDTSS